MLGRRRMIWLAMALIIVGASLQTSAYSLSHLIIGRVITGLGTGIDSSTVPMYQSELCRKEWRGRIVAWEIWFIGIGIVLAYVSTHCTFKGRLEFNFVSVLTDDRSGSTMPSHTPTARLRGERRSACSSSLP